MADQTAIKNITEQTHEIFDAKQEIWQLIDDSYKGGITYRNGDYLHKFSLRESNASYIERKKRAVYLNNVQPLADMMTGFLFGTAPIREEFQSKFIVENANLYSSLDQFMMSVARNSILFPTGILVDSPRFNRAVIQTEGDRIKAGINPYCVLYHPWQIRNFCFGKDGKLQWILLDNSFTENSDPMKEAQDVTLYRLWTRTYFQDFIKTTNEGKIPMYDQYGDFKSEYDADTFAAGEQIFHGLPEIPFIFSNWQDKDNAHLADTIFEDIAIFDQAIYNYMSLMDEMLAGGTFKFLFYPGDVPEEVKSAGFSNLAVISFPPEGNAPFFGGPALGDIGPFLEAMGFYLVGILRTLGLNTDQEKSYVQSGEAKKYDYKKTQSFLVAGARAMERVEHEIFRLAGLWTGTDDSKAKIEYSRDFLGDEQQAELDRMYLILTTPYEALKKQAAKRIARLNFSDVLKQSELKQIEADIDSTENPMINPSIREEMPDDTSDDDELKQPEAGNDKTT